MSAYEIKVSITDGASSRFMLCLQSTRFFSHRHLDISNTEDQDGIFVNPNHVLKRIIVSLPNLVSLDISGTNLAGEGLYPIMQYPRIIHHQRSNYFYIHCHGDKIEIFPTNYGSMNFK